MDKIGKYCIYPLVFRLVIYLAAVSSPLLSPSIAIGYDKSGFVFWFIFIPLEIILAWFIAAMPVRHDRALPPAAGGGKRALYTALAAAMPLFFLPVPGFAPLLPGAYISVSVILLFNILVFRSGVVSLVFIEPGFIFFVFFRLLEFSRASESLRQNSALLIPLYFVMLIIFYLVLSVIVYGSSGGQRLSDFRREIFLFLAVIAPLAAAAALFIPADYIVNDIILNFRDEKAIPGSASGSEDMDRDSRVSGVPAERWGRRSRASGSGRQYAVMIVSSDRDEVYSAWEYLGGFDSTRGFVFLPESGSEAAAEERKLNMLKNQRFLETWTNDPSSHEDEYREDINSFFLSTLPERVVPYLPVEIAPTIYSPDSYPFSYSYSSLSLVSPLDLSVIEALSPGELSDEEKRELAQYLEVPLSSGHEDIFRNYLDKAVAPDSGPGKRAASIIRSFSSFRYELGYEEDSSVERLSRFISGEFTGDCTEFSNAAALLGRLAGIPTRVARGYLASQGLQSPAHRMALSALLESPGLAEKIPPGNLMLVTTAHRHSWVQFYISGFGWVDFEATEFAIPPEGGDPNSAQIVIPVIRAPGGRPETFAFPWKILVSLFFIMILLVILGLYLWKATLFAYLALMSRKDVSSSFIARYRYILHRMFLKGCDVKKKTSTPVEYGKANTELLEFASLFTELLYRSGYGEGDYAKLTERFDKEYKRLYLISAPSGAGGWIKYIFSLKGIFY